MKFITTSFSKLWYSDTMKNKTLKPDGSWDWEADGYKPCPPTGLHPDHKAAIEAGYADNPPRALTTAEEIGLFWAAIMGQV